MSFTNDYLTLGIIIILNLITFSKLYKQYVVYISIKIIQYEVDSTHSYIYI